MDKTLKLSGKDHIRKHDAEHKSKNQVVECFSHNFCRTFIDAGIALGKDFCRNCVQLVHGLAERLALEIGKQHDRPLPVDTLNGAGAASFTNVDHVRNLDQAAVFGPDIQSAEVRRIPAVLRIQPGTNVIAAPPRFILEFGDFNFTADQEIDCLADGCRLNPKISSLVTVNIDPQFRLPRFERCVDVDDSGEFRILQVNISVTTGDSNVITRFS